MNKKSIGFFILGLAIGAVSGVIASKKYYKKIADDEIKSVIKVFNEKQAVQKQDKVNVVEEAKEKLNSPSKTQNENVNPINMKSYADYISDANNKVNYSRHIESPVPGDESPIDNSVQIITSDECREYADEYDYAEETLNVYPNGIITDEDDYPVNVEALRYGIGDDWERIIFKDPPAEQNGCKYIVNKDLKKVYEFLLGDLEYSNVEEED